MSPLWEEGELDHKFGRFQLGIVLFAELPVFLHVVGPFYLVLQADVGAN